MERCVHQILTLLDIIENFASEGEEPTINQTAGTGNVRDFPDDTASLQRYLMETSGWGNSDKTGNLATSLEILDESRQWKVGQAVGIIRQKDVVLLNEASHAQ